MISSDRASDDWILVETSEEVDAAVELLNDGLNATTLALTPGTYQRLTDRLNTVVGIDRYVRTDEHDEIGRRNQPFVHNLCRTLDEELIDRVPSLSSGFAPFRALAHQLLRCIDIAAYRWQEISNFITTERPATVHYWCGYEEAFAVEDEVPVNHGRLPLVWGEHESETTQLLRHGAFEDASVEFCCHGTVRPGYDDQDGNGNIREQSKRLAKRLANPNRTFGLRKTNFEHLGWPSGNGRLLFFQLNPFALDFVEDAVERQDIDIDFWRVFDRDPVSVRTGRTQRTVAPNTDPFKSWERGFAETFLTDHWEGNSGLDTVPTPVAGAARVRLARFISNRLSTAYRLFHRTQSYVTGRSVRGALCGPNDQFRTQIVAQACQSNDVPVVDFQHGGAYGYRRDIRDFNEYSNDIFAAFGEKVSRRFEAGAREHGFDIRGVTVGLDSLRVGHNRRSLDPDSVEDKVVLDVNEPATLVYVPARFLGPFRITPNFWPSDLMYLRHQLEIFDVLSQVDGYEIIIKQSYKNRQENPVVALAEERFPTFRPTYISDQPLVEVLPKADVVMLNFPDTVLLESLLMNKYVVYLSTGWDKWYPDARSLAEQTITYIDADDWKPELRTELKRVIDGEVTQRHGEFIRNYCSPEYTPESLWRHL